MADRLAYERRQGNSPPHEQPSPPLLTESPASERAQQLEHKFEQANNQAIFRNWSLRHLHDHTVSDFIDSPGFGVSRRIEPRARLIVLPAIESIPLPPPDYVPEASAVDSTAIRTPAP